MSELVGDLRWQMEGFKQGKTEFLEYQIKPMTHETLGDLVESSLELAFA